MNESRQRDLLVMTIAIQLSIVVVILPELFLLLIVSGFMTLSVIANEVIRRLDAYAEG
ncbi:hypothetical protein [Salinarchaeum laminariae]|uniref:hypothetical protein n=1 Tax=Salinarchaeum laminariae TaxID=869888 RepID=UPI0020BE72D5|nr:hypothetical protein [Salinarchaeum laminariae]